MQAQEETSRGIEVYLAVTVLYAISAFAINRIMAFIEKRVRVPGFVVAGAPDGRPLTWAISTSPSSTGTSSATSSSRASTSASMLTVVATLGGIIFGTVLALMRLSGKKWLDAAGRHLRQRHALAFRW